MAAGKGRGKGAAPLAPVGLDDLREVANEAKAKHRPNTRKRYQTRMNDLMVSKGRILAEG